MHNHHQRLANDEEGIGESDSLGTSSAGSEPDPLSALLTSINRTVPSQPYSTIGICNGSMLNVGNSNIVSVGNNVETSVDGGKSSTSTLRSDSTPHQLPATSLFCVDQIGVKCPICMEPFRQPKVLACFHSFCKCCLERQLIERELSETENPELQDRRKAQLLQQQLRNGDDDEDPPGPILICPLCHVETQLSFQLGIDGLLNDYGLMNAVNARRRLTKTDANNSNGEEKNGVLIFGSPSSTSSSPPLDDVCNQNPSSASRTRSPASCTCCKSGELASAFCNTCSHFLCVNCTFAHRYMICFEGHCVEDLASSTNGSVAVSSGSSSGIGSSGASGGDSSSGTSPPTQNVAPQVVNVAAVAASVTEAAISSTINTSSANSSEILNIDADKNNSSVTNDSHCKCLEHRSQPLRFFCLSCNLAICRDCTLNEHIAPMHNVETIDNVAEKQIGMMEALINEARNKQSELHEIFRLIDTDQNRLNASFQQAQSNVDESVNCLIEIIQEARKTLSKELENAFGYKQLQLTIIDKEVQKMTKKMSQTIEFTQRLLKYSSPTEVMVFKPLLDSRIQGFLNFNADTTNFLHNACEIETQPLNATQARQAIFSLMSGIQSNAVARMTSNTTADSAWSDSVSSNNQQQILAQDQNQQMHISSVSPTSMLLLNRHQSLAGNSNSLISSIGRPISRQLRSSPPVGSVGTRLISSHFDANFVAALSDSNLTNCRQDFGSNSSLNASNGLLGGNSSTIGIPIHSSGNSHLNANESNGLVIGASAPAGAANFLSQRLDNNSLGLGATSNTTTSASAGTASNMTSIFNQYEKWSSGLDPSSLGALSLSDPDTITDLSILANAQLGSDKLGALGAGSAAVNAFQLYPLRSQIKRLKMTYHCKFGEFGVMEGQFTEPSGVAVNAQNDIIVADTNNHRIQVFDKEGRFKFQFGECGKRDGQLLYPNRVSVNRVTGDFIVTERSPTHQIQIYNQYGNFVRKFGANILQHPRGVCVDSQGRIIVVECKVMRVIIFDAYGNVIHKFSCSRYLEFPNGVCTNDKNEILISDNRAHCIKVFNYEGHYVRQIGGEGITNYPIGVGINAAGEVIVADNHNNFNLTVFSQDGTMLNALESKVKHAQCFDVALVEDNSVVLASKDYRLYLYRYQSQPSQQQLSL